MYLRQSICICCKSFAKDVNLTASDFPAINTLGSFNAENTTVNVKEKSENKFRMVTCTWDIYGEL